MKLFLLLTVLAASSAMASTRDQQIIQVTSAGSATVELKADRTHTEYRTETQPRTCYQRVIVGYQTQCTPPRPDRPGQCHQIPIWRDMPYTCYVNVSVPYQVFDYTVEAKVGLEFGERPAQANPTQITITLEGDRLSYSAKGSPTHIVELASFLENTTIVGPSLRMKQASAKINFVDAAPYKAALKMSTASVKKSVLTYKLGSTEGLLLKHTLKLAKDPIIGSSTILFSDALSDTVLSREVTGGATSYAVAFKDLIGRVLGNGRYSVDISSDFGGGEVLNDQELGGLKTSKSILYKIN